MNAVPDVGQYRGVYVRKAAAGSVRQTERQTALHESEASIQFREHHDRQHLESKFGGIENGKHSGARHI